MRHLLPPFTRALTRYPASNFARGVTLSAHLGQPDFDLALRQYETYLQALRDCGLELTVLPRRRSLSRWSFCLKTRS